MRNKKFLRNWLILLGLVAVLFFGVKGYWSALQGPVDSSDTKLRAFVIQKGESVDSIAKRLEQERFIKSSFVFKYILKQKGMEGKIQAGDFKLSSAMSMEELVKNMSSGAVDVWVTFLEGWRNEEMAQELNNELGIKNNEFLKAAKGKQGYLFPDTYLINKDVTASEVVSLLSNTFDTKLPDDFETKVKKFGLTVEEAVTLASIVEREGRSEEVKTQVASILLKRLNMGMKLDVDATVRYAIDSEKLATGAKAEKLWGPITQADYSGVKSDYNTYLNAGLPPTPICNPGLVSLKAVMNANPNTPYLYYYHDSKGNSYYAETLEEHNRNYTNNR